MATPVGTPIVPDDGAFVGRNGELERLRAALQGMLAGHGRNVMIAGEPGIGKSRIARELGREAVERGAVVLWGRCHEDVGAPSYWPWVQVIRGALRIGNPVAELPGLGQGPEDIAEILPDLRAALPDEDDAFSDARFRMFEAVLALLLAASERTPLVLILDDLHWSDVPSLRLLEFVAQEISAARLLLVGTYRTTELARQHPLSDVLGNLTRIPDMIRLKLRGLGAEEVQALIETAIRGRGSRLLAQALHRQTEGNPLFLHEIMRFLDQSGIAQSGQGADGSELPATIRIPEGLKEVIGRRLNFLSPACVRTLGLAAVIGRDFTHDTLSQAAKVLERDLRLEYLDEAIAAHIVEAIDVRHYQFTHILIREMLYDELRLAERSRMHRAVGQAVEAAQTSGPGGALAELAHHFLEAGELERALDYAMRAGISADEMLAFEDAEQCFRLVLDTLDRLSAKNDALRGRVLLRLGESQRKSGSLPAAQRTLREAAEAARQLGDHESLAKAALGFEWVSWRTERLSDTHPEELLATALGMVPAADVRLQVRLTGALARALLYAGAVRPARRKLDWAIARARDLGDERLLSSTMNYTFDFPWGPDGAEDLRAIAAEAADLADRCANTEVAFLARGRIASCSLELGDIAEAERQIAIVSGGRRQLLRLDHGVSFGIQAMIALMRGKLETAERLLVAASSVAHRFDYQLAYFSVPIFSLRREQGRLKEIGPALAAVMATQATTRLWRPGLAVLYLELGRLPEARAEFEQLAAADFRDLPQDGRWTTCLIFLAEVCAALGDAHRADVLYKLLHPYAERVLVLGGSVCAGAAGRHLGLLSATAGHWARAEQHFEEALALNERIGAYLPLGHTRHDYAAMLLARNAPGDRAAAAALLRAAQGTAKRLGLSALEARVTTRLAQAVGDGVERPGADLTPREVEVLGLMVLGRSNGDISIALAISLNTVATHVRRILAKTGCANRTEAASFAIRNGLVSDDRS